MEVSKKEEYNNNNSKHELTERKVKSFVFSWQWRLSLLHEEHNDLETSRGNAMEGLIVVVVVPVDNDINEGRRERAHCCRWRRQLTAFAGIEIHWTLCVLLLNKIQTRKRESKEREREREWEIVSPVWTATNCSLVVAVGKHHEQQQWFCSTRESAAHDKKSTEEKRTN